MSKINTGLEIRFPKNLVKVKREKYHKGRKKTKKKKKQQQQVAPPGFEPAPQLPPS